MNCDVNPMAFHLMRKDQCLAICDMLDDKDKMLQDWVMFSEGKLRFQFRSSSNVNTNMNVAYYYSITVTTARKRPLNGSCFSEVNETECYAPPPVDKHYCITSAVMCDWINNCGVAAWFDENKSHCDNPHPQLSYVSIFAVMSLIIFSLMAGSHILLTSLPQASFFFVYNINEDNRFCIDPKKAFPELQSPIKETWKEDDPNDSSDDSDNEEDSMLTDRDGLPLTRVSVLSQANEAIRQGVMDYNT
ncbi:hypothetical protein CASFOL_043062 [Castilleja foliolosa]|uniref:Uncharacterized protein n=1 Tax=Castilleja foliolosa TaxID=1961234 RepID=A0ABD3B859_9LAMI